MGLILDSSVVIAAERRGDTIEHFIERVVNVTGDQDAALSAIGLTELIHGLYRAKTPAIRLRRESFLTELLADLTVYPYTKETAMLAGKLDGEQQSKGVVIPFGDLLIGATALSLGYSVLTVNLRDFRRIPGFSVVQFCLERNPNRPTVGRAGGRRQLLSSGVRGGSRCSRPRRITSSLSDAPCAASCASHDPPAMGSSFSC